jgi:hypothetical protein
MTTTDLPALPWPAWPVSKPGAWLEGGGLIRKDLSLKPAYAALRNLIRGQWATRSEGRTDKSGKFSFRGVRGQYVARIATGGKVIEQPFHVGPRDHDAIKIALREEPPDRPAVTSP